MRQFSANSRKTAHVRQFIFRLRITLYNRWGYGWSIQCLKFLFSFSWRDWLLVGETGNPKYLLEGWTAAGRQGNLRREGCFCVASDWFWEEPLFSSSSICHGPQAGTIKYTEDQWQCCTCDFSSHCPHYWSPSLLEWGWAKKIYRPILSNYSSTQPMKTLLLLL